MDGMCTRNIIQILLLNNYEEKTEYHTRKDESM